MDHRPPHLPSFHFKLRQPPSREETILLFVLGYIFFGKWQTSLLNISCLIFDIFPWDPTSPRNGLEIKMLLFFRDRQYCFWRARHDHKHDLAENTAVAIRSLETWVGVYEHTTLSILIFWLTAFQIFTVSGNSLIEMVPFLWTFSHKFICICLGNTLDQWTMQELGVSILPKPKIHI